MRSFYLLMVAVLGLQLTGCALHDSEKYEKNQSVATLATQSTGTATHQKVTQLKPLTRGVLKDPALVSVYAGPIKLDNHYSVIGTETISAYNTAGNKRQKAVIHDALRRMAAAMGGDAIINITQHDHHISGTVIAFKQNDSNRMATQLHS